MQLTRANSSILLRVRAIFILYSIVGALTSKSAYALSLDRLVVTYIYASNHFYLSAQSKTLSAVNIIGTIIDDMKLPHQGKPHGVPNHYNWFHKPRVGMGNNPGSFRTITAWGQLYEDAMGNPAHNTRVQIRDLMTYVLSKKDGQWHLLQNSRRVEGKAYREDFAGDISKPADIRNESDGSISVTAGGGFNFHFWTVSGRAAIDPNDIGGVFITAQARLIVADPKKPDDRNQALYLLSIGGDYWSSLTAKWNNWKTNGDIGIGRFKYVTKDWKSFTMTTVSAQTLQNNPPP